LRGSTPGLAFIESMIGQQHVNVAQGSTAIAEVFDVSSRS
jgi:hypothetical protein